MSENDSNNDQKSETSAVEALTAELSAKRSLLVSSLEAAGKDAALISTLLEEVKTKRSEFESNSSAAITAFQQAIEKIKQSSVEFDALKEHVTTAKAAIDSDRTSAQQAAEKAKGAQSEAENLKTEVATIKGAIESTRQTANADAAVINQSKNDVEGMRAAASALAEKLTNEHDEIASRVTALQDQQSTLQSLLQDLVNAKSTAESDSAAAKAQIAEIQNARTAFANLNNDTQAQYDSLVQRQTALQAKIVEIEDANNQIGNLRRALLVSSEDAKSVQDEINDLRSQITSVLQTTSDHRDAAIRDLAALKEKAESDGTALSNSLTEQFNKLHDSLQSRILSLLPSAGAAGLSSTYYDAKSRYAPTSFGGIAGSNTQRGFWSSVRRIFGHNPASVVATIAFYAMFIIPLAVIAWGSFSLLQKMENDHFLVDWKMLAVRFLIAVPLATISSFGFASLRRYRRLFEEYNHKQRVMELYQSFKEEIDLVGGEEQKKNLLTIMLNSVASKAWEDIQEPSADPKAPDTLSSIERFIADIAKVKAIFS